MREFDIASYGAVADGETVNTKAIQEAIDDCASQGGGRVIVNGGVFVTCTVFMKSNVDLCIEASANTDDYPDFPCEEFNVKACTLTTQLLI